MFFGVIFRQFCTVLVSQPLLRVGYISGESTLLPKAAVPHYVQGSGEPNWLFSLCLLQVQLGLFALCEFPRRFYVRATCILGSTKYTNSFRTKNSPLSADAMLHGLAGSCF